MRNYIPKSSLRRSQGLRFNSFTDLYLRYLLVTKQADTRWNYFKFLLSISKAIIKQKLSK